MKTPKFAGPVSKKKRPKKSHITKNEYRRTRASNVDASLDQFFSKSEPVHRKYLGPKDTDLMKGLSKVKAREAHL